MQIASVEDAVIFLLLHSTPVRAELVEAPRAISPFALSFSKRRPAYPRL
jgi:hypothetical protein